MSEILAAIGLFMVGIIVIPMAILLVIGLAELVHSIMKKEHF